ncbi:hypothetical protein THASP1DRAFT_27215 [Thamnocephalis sphaerospora]|uniref:Uncharacterized protein n=1 Tax=Thamnocephalis sphaerospora TaxID=78915 RepID=A0A4P9XY73_9FUNG|nr:hypothetical protein THASP1DRAFT_27215 [Thamnocephalis sphaerospora]|eukprot:RKP11042.1 hypothetical protein THASP1DRAFT_27215 [Thamnocephalis sphaerospora]
MISPSSELSWHGTPVDPTTTAAYALSPASGSLSTLLYGTSRAASADLLLVDDGASNEGAGDFSLFLDGYFGQRRSYRVGPTITLEALNSVSILTGGASQSLTTSSASSSPLLPPSIGSLETVAKSQIAEQPLANAVPLSPVSPARELSPKQLQTNDMADGQTMGALEPLLPLETLSELGHALLTQSLDLVGSNVTTQHERVAVSPSPKRAQKTATSPSHATQPLAASADAHAEAAVNCPTPPSPPETRTFDILEIWQMNDPCADFRHEIAMNTLARQGYYPK